MVCTLTVFAVALANLALTMCMFIASHAYISLRTTDFDFPTDVATYYAGCQFGEEIHCLSLPLSPDALDITLINPSFIHSFIYLFIFCCFLKKAVELLEAIAKPLLCLVQNSPGHSYRSQ